jgi:hypothetical protein
MIGTTLCIGCLLMFLIHQVHNFRIHTTFSITHSLARWRNLRCRNLSRIVEMYGIVGRCVRNQMTLLSLYNFNFIIILSYTSFLFKIIFKNKLYICLSMMCLMFLVREVKDDIFIVLLIYHCLLSNIFYFS